MNCCISYTFLNLHFWSSLGQFILGFLIHQHYSKIKVLLYNMQVEKKFPPGKIASFIDFVWNNNWFSHNFFSNLLLLCTASEKSASVTSKTNNFKWFDIFFFLSAKTSTKFTKTKTGHTYDNPSHQGLRGQFCSLKNDLSSWSRQMWSSHGFPHF